MVGIKQYHGEHELMTFAFAQLFLGENNRIYDSVALTKFLTAKNTSTEMWREVILSRYLFEHSVTACGYPKLFGIWQDQRLSGYILQGAIHTLRSNDLPVEVQQQVQEYFFS